MQLLAFFMLLMMMFYLWHKTKISQVAPAQGDIDPENASSPALPSGTDTKVQVPGPRQGYRGGRLQTATRKKDGD